MNRTLRTLTLSSCTLTLLGACAEAAPTRNDAGRDAFAAPGEDAFTTSADAFVAPGTDAFRPPMDAFSAGSLVINELAPDGDPDFVELYNPTSSAVAVGGWIVADADGVATPPDATHRTTFPTLDVPPGGYLVVAMNVDPPAGSMETPVGPVSPCPVAGVDSCLQTSYGIGRTGDTIVLLAADGATELARVEYVGDLMGAAQSHCRFPNATGDFATCTSTPGAANAM
ncbi:MAG: lamin tail domain-containing protein [Deltaproteobacteria bacterium]|nr:lamin tail domain-containing protein [Deltaproteobacteria bacterium]